MARYGLFVISLFLLSHSLNRLVADPPADPFQNTLAIQKAMEQAQAFLLQKGEARKAVTILEENLARINGNSTYLVLLRDAYRASIQELWLERQDALAQKYLERLAILDADAARAFTQGKVVRENRKNSPGLLEKLKLPGLNLAQLSPPRIGLPLVSKPSPTVRAKADDDPFDLAYRRISLNKSEVRGQKSEVGGQKSEVQKQLERSLLEQAEAEYARGRFREAHLLFNQAFQADPVLLKNSLPRWAYCKFNFVVEQLNQGNLEKTALPALEREVRTAMEMAPGLEKTGHWLLGEIDQRRKAGVRGQGSLLTPISVKHLGRTSQGWQMAETSHFRIYHKHTAEFAEKVARVAETTRRDMYRKWFGTDGPDWKPRCDLYLHASAADYTRASGVPGQSPGHSRFEIEASGRVAARRMDLHCDVPTMLSAVLPHETTHVVLAGQFGRHAVPRWADEGMAVLTEPQDKIEQHRKNLVRNRRDGQLFQVRELMHLQDYPQPRRLGAFYAQSVVLVDYLCRLRGPRVFTEFLRDGLQEGYENALVRHYGIRDFNDLQGRWNRQVLAELERVNPSFAGR